MLLTVHLRSDSSSVEYCPDMGCVGIQEASSASQVLLMFHCHLRKKLLVSAGMCGDSDHHNDNDDY